MKNHIVYSSPIICDMKRECVSKVKEIRNSMEPKELTTEDIVRLTEEGHSFQFGLSVKKGWCSQSLFGVDVDNLQGLSLNRLIKKLGRLKLPPYAIFASLGSDTQIIPTRFHFYFALNQPVKDPVTMQHIIRLTCDTITSITSKETVDYQCTDTGRLFFPGHKIYMAPEKKILLKNVIPLADILYSGNVILLDRVWFMKQLKEHFDSCYGASGTIFYPFPDIPDHVLIGTRKNKNKNTELVFLECQNAPLVYTLEKINTLWNPFSISYKLYRNEKKIIDINNKFVGNSNSRKSTDDKLYYAKVNNIHRSLYLCVLSNYLADVSGNEKFRYESVKNEEKNLEILLQIFKTELSTVTKESLLDNLTRFQTFVMNPDQKTYPSLYKVLFPPGRKEILLAILKIARSGVGTLPQKNIVSSLQHILTVKMILTMIHKDVSSVKSSRISSLIQLFHELGFINILEKDQYASRIKYKLRPLTHKPYGPRTVVTLPWFDHYLLNRADQKAEQFCKEKKTVMGLVKINAKNRETYLALKNCVISTLNIYHYVTRAMLISIAETENLCQSGHKGDFIVDRYLPTIAKELQLVKKSYSKELACLFSVPDPDLKYGLSKLYIRKDFIENHVKNHSTAA